MSQVKLSIITVAIDDFQGLCKTIDSVGTSTQLQHIIKLIPNNIDAQLLKSIYPHLDIIVLDDVGIYDAMNQALAYVRAPHMLFLNVRDRFIPRSLPLVLHLLDLSSADVVFKFLPLVYGREHYERASFLFFSRHMLNHQTIVYPVSYFSFYKFNLSCKVIADLRHCLESGLYKNISYIDVPVIDYDMSSNFALQASSIRSNWLERLGAYRWSIPLQYRLILTFMAVLGIVHVTFFRRFNFLWK